MNALAGSFRYRCTRWCTTAIIRGWDIVHPSCLALQDCNPRSRVLFAVLCHLTAWGTTGLCGSFVPSCDYAIQRYRYKAEARQRAEGG